MYTLNCFGPSKTRQATILSAFVLVLSFSLTSGLLGQGKLGRVREAVRHHDSPPAEKKHRHREDESNDEKHTYHGGHQNRRHRSDCGPSFGPVFTAPRSFYNYRPQRIFHEHIHVVEPTPLIVTKPLDETYFDQGVSDSMALSQSPLGPTWESEFENWSGRLSSTYGYDFEEITQGYFGLLLQSPGGFGLDTSVMMFRENGGTFRDHLWMGDVNLVYEVINSGDFRARMGVGINWLGDQYGGESGFNLTTGFDWQLSPEWVLTGETDFGNLGDSDLFRGELSIGRQIGNAEWATGYRHSDIGGTSLGSVFTGFRFRF
jgi:hypothetical protein